MEKHRFFSFYNRDGVFYVKFREEGQKSFGSGHNTGYTDRSEAEMAVKWYLNGQLASFKKGGAKEKSHPEAEILIATQRFFDSLHHLPFSADQVKRIIFIMKERKLLVEKESENPHLIPFLEHFWNFDESEYIQGRVNKDKSISRRHAYDMTMHVRGHWKEYFKEILLNDVRLIEIERFGTFLKKKGLQGKTINNIMNAGLASFSWAAKRKLISEDPGAIYDDFAIKNRKRGVLTKEEVKKLFSLNWPDEGAKFANLLAASTGMRAGEIMALRVKDIDEFENLILVDAAFGEQNGFTQPKCGSVRFTVLFSEIKIALLEHVKKIYLNPQPEDLVFPGKSPEHPKYREFFNESLKEMLLKLDSDITKWKARNVVFHSWRHYFAARMLELCDPKLVKQMTGHKSEEVFNKYTNHPTSEQVEEATGAVGKLFRDILTLGSESPNFQAKIKCPNTLDPFCDAE